MMRWEYSPKPSEKTLSNFALGQKNQVAALLPHTLVKPIDQLRLKTLLRLEEQKYLVDHPKSHEFFEQACRSMQTGVQMLWMIRFTNIKTPPII